MHARQLEARRKKGLTEKAPTIRRRWPRETAAKQIATSPAHARSASAVRELETRFSRTQVEVLSDLYKRCEYESKLRAQDEAGKFALEVEHQRPAIAKFTVAKNSSLLHRRSSSSLRKQDCALLRLGGKGSQSPSAIGPGKLRKGLHKGLTRGSSIRSSRSTNSKRKIKNRSQRHSLTPTEAYLKFCSANSLMPKYRSSVHIHEKELTVTKHVKKIDISNRAMGSHQVAAFVHAFSASDTHAPVEHWNLRANGLVGSDLDTTLQQLHPECVVELDVSQNPKLGPSACSHLTNLIFHTANCQLQDLDMSNCSIRSAGAQLLAGGLRNNTSLLRLNLARNMIEESGARELAGALGDRVEVTRCVLDELNLAWNMIGSAAPVLLSLNCINVMNLSHNTLNGEGVVELVSEALRFNKTLLHLDLCNCGFTPTMIRSLGSALRDNHTLIGIHVEDHDTMNKEHNNHHTRDYDENHSQSNNGPTALSPSAKVPILQLSPTSKALHDAGRQSDDPLVAFTDSKGYIVVVPASVRFLLYDLICGQPGESPNIHCADLPKDASIRPEVDGRVFATLTQGTSTRSLFEEDQTEETGSSMNHRHQLHTKATHWINSPSAECSLDFKYRTCWMCGGFTETKFVWENKFDLPVTHVYLHLQADYFRPQAMHVDKGKATDKNMRGANHKLFTLRRQLPPGRQHFYFTWHSDPATLHLQERDDGMYSKVKQTTLGHPNRDSSEHEMLSMDYPTTFFPYKFFLETLEKANGGDVDGDGIPDVGEQVNKEVARRARGDFTPRVGISTPDDLGNVTAHPWRSGPPTSRDTSSASPQNARGDPAITIAIAPAPATATTAAVAESTSHPLVGVAAVTHGNHVSNSNSGSDSDSSEDANMKEMNYIEVRLAT